jgi:hypothetical protein
MRHYVWYKFTYRKKVGVRDQTREERACLPGLLPPNKPIAVVRVDGQQDEQGILSIQVCGIAGQDDHGGKKGSIVCTCCVV